MSKLHKWQGVYLTIIGKVKGNILAIEKQRVFAESFENRPAGPVLV